MRTRSNRAGGTSATTVVPALLGALLIASSLLACSGKIGPQSGTSGGSTTSQPTSGTGPGSVGSSGGSGSGVAPLDCTIPNPGASLIRRLTRFEYSNTVRDLLGDTTRPGDLLPPEEQGNGFSNDAATVTTTRLLADAYQSVAHATAARAVANAATLAQLAPCDTAKTTEAACAQAFVTDFGTKAFRRPIDAEESAAMMGVYDAGTVGGAYADGIASVIEMVLQLPQFLYRVELGVPSAISAVARPSSYEMASRLSYFLWGSMPDAALLDAAKAGQLDTKEQVAAQANTMLADPRVHDVVTFFHDTLYGIIGLDGLQRDTTFFPTYSSSLGALFREETEHFLDDVVWNGAGDFKTMMTGAYTFLNGPLATFYGIPGVTGDAFQRVNLDKTRRGGILTQASVLTATTPGSHNNPVVRGKFVYTELLCGVVPDPPPGLNIVEPVETPTMTTRELFMAHRQPACAGCHARLDNVGFGFEHYNGVGLWQDLDNGQAIDDTGNIPDGDIAGNFKGVIELATKIASSTQAHDCYVGQWLNFAYGRTAQQADACTRQELTTAFEKSNGNVKDLLVALTQTDAFLYRPLQNP